MIKNKPTLSIGIPAFNEEANIAHLLKELLRQETKNFILKSIIVVSDGSTDNTEKLVKSLRSKKIKLYINQERLGLNATQNKILKNSSSDILVLFDADVLPADSECVSRLIQPIIDDPKVGLTSGKLYALRVLNKLWVRVFANVHEMKRKMCEALPNPNNIYLCAGRMRAFSKALYSRMHWSNDVPEDAYSYLFAVRNGFDFCYTPKAICYFHTPATVADHIVQNKRFISGKLALNKYFSSEQLNKEYALNPLHVLKYIFIYSIKRPISIPIYLLLMTYLHLFIGAKKDDHSMYKIALSSKNIIYAKK